MLDYSLSLEEKLLVDLVERIGREYIAPHAREWDEKEEFDPRPIKALAQADLFGLVIPSEYGGLGWGTLALCLAVEHLSKYCPGVATTYAASFLGAYPILLFGSRAQKEKYLPEVARGRKLCAFALTEPQAGSDAAAIKTRAERDGDYYILNGLKQWITNGGIADIYIVIALTDPRKGARGASAFIVEKGDPGFSVGRKEKKMGLRASVTTELFFTECRIPRDRLLSREGMGFIVAMRTLDYARVGVGAQAVGLAQGAMELSLRHARSRVQFGQPVYHFQAVSHTFAEMAMRIEAARALVYQTARFLDSGAKEISGPSAMAKAFATDVAMWVAERAVQMMGGYGYMRDYGAEKFMRDAKCLQIYEGTNEIQRVVIARELLKYYRD
ncbi:MAG TPA: acyl-CoA dehydrogenase [Thermosulfurimonas dismutans]|uniref:Cyclohex-1-ene-1-carbonyl-CoA dehydrogenase n=1 Tax=Thermosulfurimonas dismutans TaxID=999894 RepID=A0A7C3CS38_9BACT|nr:acyl-CoA dehydrogenase [Thermosulfurimonas dismutans]